MNKKSWSPEELAEHDDLMAEVCDATKDSRQRVQLFLSKITDAVQARRLWARDLERYATYLGAATYVKHWDKARREVAVSYNGRLLTKPAVVGITGIDGAGDPVFQQRLFFFFSWEEIERKRTEYMRQIQAYKVDIHICDRLLALRDLAPAAINPDEAARSIGTSVEEWLSEVSA